MKSIAKRVVGAAARALRSVSRSAPFDATRYWEERYSSGGTSGDGSYGLLADFKARVVNEFVVENTIASAIEFGCGDGHQLSLMRFPAYIGLDVSRSAVGRCTSRFSNDVTKRFLVYDPERFRDPAGIFRAELALSLDVIYHLVSDRMFERYMGHLCDSASRFLMVYSTDIDQVRSQHMRHRKFTKWMAAKRPDFRLDRITSNPYAGTGQQQSNAAFFFFERIS